MSGATHLFISQHTDFAVQQNGTADSRGDVYLSVTVLEIRAEFSKGAIAGQDELPLQQRSMSGYLELMITTALRFERPDRRFNFVEGFRRLARQQQVIRRSGLIFPGLAEFPRLIHMADASLPLLSAILIVFLPLVWRRHLERYRPDIVHVSLLAVPRFRNIFLFLHRYHRQPVVLRLFYRRLARPSNHVLVAQPLRQGLFRLFRVLDPLRGEYHLIVYVFLRRVVEMRIYRGNERERVLC